MFFPHQTGYVSSTAEKQNRPRLKDCFHELGPMCCTDPALWDVAPWHSIDHLGQALATLHSTKEITDPLQHSFVSKCLNEVALSIPPFCKVRAAVLYFIASHSFSALRKEAAVRGSMRHRYAISAAHGLGVVRTLQYYSASGQTRCPTLWISSRRRYHS